MKKEKYTMSSVNSEVKIEENEIVSFNKFDKTISSFRVHKDGFVGVYMHQGKISDKEGFEKAELNLEAKRPYPFELSGGVRSMDKVEKLLSDSELMSKARNELAFLKKNFPDFTFSGNVFTEEYSEAHKNSAGMNFSMHDGYNGINIFYKHKNSKDLDDGHFSVSMRKWSSVKFRKMAANYLSNFGKFFEMPEDCIIMLPEWNLNGKLKEALNAEGIALGTSLLAGKIGQKVFSDELSVYHDVSKKNIWMSTFWDAEGAVPKGDKLAYIKNGLVLRGYADKRVAKKYGVECTGSAYANYSDIPQNGKVHLKIKPLKLTPKEILEGLSTEELSAEKLSAEGHAPHSKLAVLPVNYSGGGFNAAGEYVMPVQRAFLTDGEKILGEVPPFTMRSNLFDMFGKDFIGVSKFTSIWNCSMMLVHMQAGKL